MNTLFDNARNNFRNLWERSVWAKGAIPENESDYADLRRVIFPLYDVTIIAAGALGAIFGVPAIEEFFPNWVTNAMGGLLVLLGILCFIGVAFPRLWRLEVASKSAVIGVFLGYMTAAILLTADGDPARGFVISLAFGFCLLPTGRLFILHRKKQTGSL